MTLGDVVEYEGHRWRVYKVDRSVRTVALIRWGGSTQEVADDDPALVVIANPSGWPVVTARLKPNAGPVAKLSIARGGKLRGLRPLVDWVPSDLMRAGGSIFINPDFKLSLGEILIAEYKDGTASRIPITKRYGSVAQRSVVRSGVKKKKGLMGFLDGEDFVK
jgi:hypothetical protein